MDTTAFHCKADILMKAYIASTSETGYKRNGG